MRYLPFALALGSAVVGHAHAAEPAKSPISVSEPQAAKPVRINFRLVPDRRGGPASVSRSGMAVSTKVAPNATVGLGLLSAAPKRTSDWRNGVRGKRPRKPSVNFQLKF